MNPDIIDPTNNLNSIKLDFRFVEIDHEIWALGAYLETLKQQFEALVEKEKERFNVRMKDEGLDEADRDMAFHEHYELVEFVLPRFVLNPMLVSLWALYEFAIIELADYVQKSQNQFLRMQDIRGNNTLDQARKYFDIVLKVPLTTDAAMPERLQMLLTLRNAIAHGNGRLDALKDDTRKKIENWESSKTGVVVQNGEWVTSSIEFLDTTYAMVKASLEDLIARVRAIR